MEVETPTASPLASSLLFDYVATYMYAGDTPNAERRAAALSLDRDLLRELLGQEELRDLIDPGAMEQLEDDLQHRSPRTRAATLDELHDVLRQVGDLTTDEVAERVHEGVDAPALLAELARRRRAVAVRVAGEERWIDAADAGLFRDALGVVAPGGLPDAFLAEVPTAMVALLRRYAATHAPFPTAQARLRYGLDPALALAELERAGDLVRGELRPGGTSGQREWCDVQVLRRLRRASLAVLRKEIEPADQRALAAFLPAWQGIGRYGGGAGSGIAAGSGSGGARAGAGRQISAAVGVERLREQLVPLQGLALTPETWERDVLPPRLGGYSPAWLDTLCAAGEIVWLGAGALARTSGRVALYFREDIALLAAPVGGGSAGVGGSASSSAHAQPEHLALRERLGAGSAFFSDLLTDLAPARAGHAGSAVGSRLGGRGHQRRLRPARLPALAPSHPLACIRRRPHQGARVAWGWAAGRASPRAAPHRPDASRHCPAVGR